jgi:hypothetical protein
MTNQKAKIAPAETKGVASPYITAFLALVDRYRVECAGDLKDITASMRIFKDSKKVTMLRAGGDLSTARLILATEAIRTLWPNDATIPHVEINQLINVVDGDHHHSPVTD